MKKDAFDLAKQLIPAAIATQNFIKSSYDSETQANMEGDWSDLATFTLINLTHIYLIFFDYADIKNDIYVFATLTRSAQELIADYIYAINHKKSDEKVKSLLAVKMFGAHAHQEYFKFIKGEISQDQVCARPEWTSTSQIDRIRKWGGFEEVSFYNLLSTYAHQSIPNERLIKHPNEIYILRSYFLGKVIMYLDILATSIVDKGGTNNKTLNRALKKYTKDLRAKVESWDKIFPDLYKFTDHYGHTIGKKEKELQKN